MNFRKQDQTILGEIWNSNELEKCIQYLCDECNGRFAGTEDERRAGEYMLAWYKRCGLENIHAHPFEMRGWQRGESRLAVVFKDGRANHPLPSLAMAGSPKAVVEAEVIDAGAGKPEDIERLGSAVAGKIVLTSSEGPHRSVKYSAAQAAGAVGFIIANGVLGGAAPVGSVALHSKSIPEIPALGISVESAGYLKRRLKEGSVYLNIVTECLPQMVTARNIIAELPGTDPAAGWIVIGGHYDGHDVAQGALDNGTGTAVVLETARLLAPLRSSLKAGIRFINFTGEELGLNGSFAYVQDYPEALDSIRAVFNIDIIGIYPPVTMMTQDSPQLAGYLNRLPLADLDGQVKEEAFIPYSDHFAFLLKGIETLMAVSSLPPDPRPWVHTVADTLDKIEMRFLRQAAATTARILLRMAADPEGLPAGRKPVSEVQAILRKAGYEEALKQQGLFPS